MGGPRGNRKLSSKQRDFIAAYLKGECKNATQAAIAAGYTPKSARHTAYVLLNKNEFVKQEIAEHRKELAKATVFTAEKAYQKAEAAIAFAIKTNNANAYVKALELQAKLHGLLIEKVDVRQSAFNVVIKTVTPNPPPLPYTELPLLNSGEEE